MDDYVQNGTPGYPCTIDYNPLYLLVNGATAPDLAGLGQTGSPSSVLLRLLNAGLHSHTPSIVGLELGLIAEDGNPYPGLIRQQSHALLPAGKTLDALVAMPADSGCDPSITTTCAYDGLALFDRLPTFNVENRSNDAPLANLFPGAVIPLPSATASLAVDDTYAVTEDTALNVSAAAGVLSNDDPGFPVPRC